MIEIEREYEYKPKWTLILLCAIGFGLCAAFFAAKAQSNDRGLIIDRIIELSVSGATAFYWVLCFLSVGFVAIATALTFHRLTYRQRIAFTPGAIIVPKSRWSPEETIIEYRSIDHISASKVSGQGFLHVTHAGGKSIINASMLPSKAAFEEVSALLAERVHVARQRVRPASARLEDKD